MDKLKLGCAVLTYGNSRQNRDDRPEDRCMILQALAAIPTRIFEAVVVVTPYWESMRRARDFHFAALYSAGPEHGVPEAIVLGLTSLRDCDGVMFLSGGRPVPPSENVAALAEKWQEKPLDFAASEQCGPWIFPAWFYPELMQAVL